MKKNMELGWPAGRTLRGVGEHEGFFVHASKGGVKACFRIDPEL